MDAHTLELTLPAAAGSVVEARTRICEALGGQLGVGQLETLKLLISEVVTNAVRHGDGVAPLELHAIWNGEVRVEVCDHGDGFTPVPRTGAPDEAGGFGLFLVSRLADRWGVDVDDGTTVWFVLRRAERVR